LDTAVGSSEAGELMITRVTGLILLLLAPGAALYLSGYPAAARDLTLGTVLALHLGVLARPLAPFSFLIAGIYAAAAITANFTDGVAALIVAVAAATGAASSVGFHRGLQAVLAAALIGSFEPAMATEAASRALMLLAGCLYGYSLVGTVARPLVVRPLAVESTTALGYSVLLAVLVLVAWFTARAVGLEQGWWLPLTVAALGEPWLKSTPGQAVSRLAIALAGTLLALVAFDMLAAPALRAVLGLALLLALLTLGRSRADVQDFLLTPFLVLLAAGATDSTYDLNVGGTLIAFVIVAAFTVLGKWVLWTLRPDTGHVVSA
jgi:hypothetical protein